MENEIILKNVTKTYTLRHNNKKINALQKIDLTILEGQIVGIIGFNGAGKTTLLKLIAGITPVSDGNITVLNHQPFRREKALLKKIGFIMGQKNQLWWDISAQDSYDIERVIYKIPKEDYQKRLDYLTKLLNIENKIQQPVRQLSLGERMKCEIVLGLLHDPKVLLLDEPTIGLDFISQNTLCEFLYQYNKERNNITLITSHNMKDIEDICDFIIILDKGRIVYNGRQSTLFQTYSKYKQIRFKTQDQLTVSTGYLIKNLRHETIILSEIEQVNHIIRQYNDDPKILQKTIEDLDLESVLHLIYDKGM